VGRRYQKVVQPDTGREASCLYAQLPDNEFRLLVETDIETGLRWGELTELRPRDINFATRMLLVTRVAVELTKRFHPDSGRFLVKEYPKDEEHRRLKLSPQISAKLEAHVDENSLGLDDLVFAVRDLENTSRRSSPGATAASVRSAVIPTISVTCSRRGDYATRNPATSQGRPTDSACRRGHFRWWNVARWFLAPCTALHRPSAITPGKRGYLEGCFSDSATGLRVQTLARRLDPTVRPLDTDIAVLDCL
jgi:integrase